MATKSHVRIALDRMAELQEEMSALVAPLQTEYESLKQAHDSYIVEHYSAGEGYEDDDWLATKVVSHTRTWNVDALMKLVPRAILKPALKVSIDTAKLDDLVKRGKIERKTIASAFTESPNKPYAKITRKSKTKERGASEAEGLAGKLK